MREYIFPPVILPLFIVLFVFPLLVFLFIFTGSAVFKIAFGFDDFTSLLLLSLIILGSLINVPLYERRGIEFVRRFEFFGFIYVVRTKEKLVLAVNIGGCVIPSILAAKLIYDTIPSLDPFIFISSLALASLMIYRLARPVTGVGIVVPMFIPSVIATSFALVAVVLSNSPTILLPKISFALAVFSTLIGADIMHLKDIERIGYGVVSIGGAGTFDGIFLSGVFSVLISVLLI